MFDLDICRSGGVQLNHIEVTFDGEGHRSKFTVVYVI